MALSPNSLTDLLDETRNMRRWTIREVPVSPILAFMSSNSAPFTRLRCDRWQLPAKGSNATVMKTTFHVADRVQLHPDVKRHETI